jgi:UDP-sulfoquinovose synthase
MKVLILGGDGYLGWATAMHLSARGHEVLAVDNYIRRSLSRSLDRDSLVDVPNLNQRADTWGAVSGQRIEVGIGDVADYQFLYRLFEEFQPDAVVHYAEIPSAPYSMMGRDQANQTLNNNLTTTLNVVFAVRDICPTCHLVKLGTMGEYGTPNIDIEEGYLEVEHNGRSDRFLFPKNPGSIYHLTKVQDSDLLYFACRTWNLAATDLNQGPVYGVHTAEMQGDISLAPLFAYDDIFGTVLNRFVVQAVVGYPLTVYGKGGQTRGYLNITDTLQCVELALNRPAAGGEFRVLNQFTETFTVNDLAEKVVAAAASSGLDAQIEHIPNPRRELEDHYYNPKNTGLLELGLEPHYLTEEVLVGMIEYVQRHEPQVRREIISPRVAWEA